MKTAKGVPHCPCGTGARGPRFSIVARAILSARALCAKRIIDKRGQGESRLRPSIIWAVARRIRLFVRWRKRHLPWQRGVAASRCWASGRRRNGGEGRAGVTRAMRLGSRGGASRVVVAMRRDATEWLSPRRIHANFAKGSTLYNGRAVSILPPLSLAGRGRHIRC